MSIFKVDASVGHPDGGDLAPIRPVVDTGAAHSMLPESLLSQLSIEPRRQLPYVLAAGRRVEYGYGLARFNISGEEWPCPVICPVIFGPDGNYLLGSSTLEIFNLVVDPTRERLAPAELLPLGWGGPLT